MEQPRTSLQPEYPFAWRLPVCVENATIDLPLIETFGNPCGPVTGRYRGQPCCLPELAPERRFEQLSGITLGKAEEASLPGGLFALSVRGPLTGLRAAQLNGAVFAATASEEFSLRTLAEPIAGTTESAIRSLFILGHEVQRVDPSHSTEVVAETEHRESVFLESEHKPVDVKGSANPRSTDTTVEATEQIVERHYDAGKVSLSAGEENKENWQTRFDAGKSFTSFGERNNGNFDDVEFDNGTTDVDLWDQFKMRMRGRHKKRAEDLPSDQHQPKPKINGQAIYDRVFDMGGDDDAHSESQESEYSGDSEPQVEAVDTGPRTVPQAESGHVTTSQRIRTENWEESMSTMEASAARRKPRQKMQPDPSPQLDWDFDFSGDGKPYRFARGKVSRIRGNRGVDTLHTIRAQLCGIEKMEFADKDGVMRHIGSLSPLGGLGECADPFCGAHRLFKPLVRPLFRDFVVAWIEKYMTQDRGLRYTSFGCGALLFDVELLERIRRVGVRIEQVCLVDRTYQNPAMDTRRALREFADWQRAAAYLDMTIPAEILAFGSTEEYFETAREGGRAFGCDVFVQCNAQWDGALEEGQRLAARAMRFGGLFARLHPEPSSKQDTGRHSSTACTASAWTRAWPAFVEPLPEGCPPLLEPLEDNVLQPRIHSITAASTAPLSEDAIQAQANAQSEAKQRGEAKRRAVEAEERSKRKEERERAQKAKPKLDTTQPTQGVQKESSRAAPPGEIKETSIKAASEEPEVRQQARIWEMEEQKFAIWKVIHQPRVLVRQEPKTSAKAVGLLYTGEQIIVSPEEHCGWLRIYEGPSRAKLPDEAWVCWDARSDGLGFMLEQVQ